MDDEKVISGYDPMIMRRLLRYTKPYIVLVVAALVSLGISTAGDLLLPVVIQRSVDEQLIGQYTRVPDASVDVDVFSQLELDGAIQIGGALYIRDDTLAAIGRAARSELERAGVLEQAHYYLSLIHI